MPQTQNQKKLQTGVSLFILMVVGIVLYQDSLQDAKEVLVTILSSPKLILIAFVIAGFVITMLTDWNSVVNTVQMPNMSLADIESTHPAFAGKKEVAFMVLFSFAFFQLGLQLMSSVGAERYSLSAETDYKLRTTQAQFVDFDHDGDLDVLSVVKQPSIFLPEVEVSSSTSSLSGSSEETTLLENSEKIETGDDSSFRSMDSSSSLSESREDSSSEGEMSTSSEPALESFFPKALAEESMLETTDASSSVALEQPNEIGDVLPSSEFVESLSSSTSSSDEQVVEEQTIDSQSPTDIDADVSALVEGENSIETSSGSSASSVTIDASKNEDLASSSIQEQGQETSKIDYSHASMILSLNDGHGVFTSTPLLFSNSIQFSRFTLGEMTGDSFVDFVAYSDETQTVYQFVNDGTGSGSLKAMTTIADVSEMMLRDMDDDGDADLLVLKKKSANTQALWINDGLGSFTPSSLALPSGDYATVADFASGEEFEIAILESTGGTLSLYSKKNQELELVSRLSITGFYDLLVDDDVDADGDVDLLTVQKDGDIRVLLNNGDGSFGLGSRFGDIGSVRAVALGDTDNDGDLDALIGGEPMSGKGGGTELWLNNGMGIFTDRALEFDSSSCLSTLALGDIDADGDLDQFAGRTGCTMEGVSSLVYASDTADRAINTQPRSAQMLTERVTASGSKTVDVLLSWGSGFDLETPPELLNYDIELRYQNGRAVIPSVHYSPYYSSGNRQSSFATQRTLRNLPCNSTNSYVWSAVTRDTGFKKTVSTSKTFTISDSCKLTQPQGFFWFRVQ